MVSKNNILGRSIPEEYGLNPEVEGNALNIWVVGKSCWVSDWNMLRYPRASISELCIIFRDLRKVCKIFWVWVTASSHKWFEIWVDQLFQMTNRIMKLDCIPIYQRYLIHILLTYRNRNIWDIITPIHLCLRNPVKSTVLNIQFSCLVKLSTITREKGCTNLLSSLLHCRLKHWSIVYWNAWLRQKQANLSDPEYWMHLGA